MKHLIILLFLGLSVIFCSSCRNNRLKTNEEELVKEIILQEKEKEEAGKVISEKQLSDTLNWQSRTFRFKEDRSVDPLHPPLVIDIAGSLNNITENKLSDVASEIRYIRLESPPDSAFRKDVGFKYHLTDDYIIAINPFGILHYTQDGKFVNTIVKNEFTRIQVLPDKVIAHGDMTFKGAYNTTVRIVGNKLFYTYLNNIAGQKYLMEYDCSEIHIGQTTRYDPENPSQIIGQGQIIVDLNHGRVIPAPPQWYQGSMWSVSFDYIYQESDIFWIDNNNYSKKLSGNNYLLGIFNEQDDNMLGIFNRQGDTLSTFVQHERLVNYTKSLQRGTDRGIQYEYNGKMYFRNAFNDTVFQIIPPNRLLPIYVLDMGSYKVNRQQGVDPDFNLTGKIIPGQFAETNHYIFITFDKDGYDCPNTRKNKTVEIYHALYSKLNHQLSVIKGDPFNYSPEILENNIDGGIPVWPSSYMIGKNGELMISLKGKDLKDRIKSEQFKLSHAPEARKKELFQLAASVSDFENILMIVK